MSKLNALSERLCALDDRACGAMRGLLSRQIGTGVYAAAYLLAAGLGFLAARVLGGAGAAEGLLCGGVFVLWCAAFFSYTRPKLIDALLCGGVLFALFAARMAALSVVSPDCRDYLLPWAQTMADMSFCEVMAGRVGDYTVLYQYFVFILSRLTLNPVVLYKLLSIGFEALLAWSAASLSCMGGGAEKDSVRFRASFLVTLAAPTVLLNSAVWAQCDAVYGALALCGVVLILRGRPHAGCVSFALSLCFKLQAVFLLPICALLLLKGRLALRHALTALATLLLAALPALLAGKGLTGVLGVYLYQMGEYRQLVLDAPTIYQLIPGGGLIPDGAASAMGVLLAAGAMCAVLALAAGKRTFGNATVTDACFALVAAIPFLLPHMHERYFFLADILSIVYAFRHPRRAWAPAVVLLCSLNGYCAYLFSSQLISWTLAALLMAGVCVGAAALLAQEEAPAE